MATHDFVIANQNGAATRADLNNALLALASRSISSTAPSTKYTGMVWTDNTSSTWEVNIWDGTAWILAYYVDTSAGRCYFVGDVYDSSGNAVMEFTGNASAVNYLIAQNAATGSHVILEAAGSDSDVDLWIQSKGTGRVWFNTSGIAMGTSKDNGISAYGSDTGISVFTADTARLRVYDAGIDALVALYGEDIFGGGATVDMQGQAAAEGLSYETAHLSVARDQNVPLYVNRYGDGGGSGRLVQFQTDGAGVGHITDDGAGTLTYGTFTGVHDTEVQGVDARALRRGTVLESTGVPFVKHYVRFTGPDGIERDSLVPAPANKDHTATGVSRDYVVPVVDRVTGRIRAEKQRRSFYRTIQRRKWNGKDVCTVVCDTPRSRAVFGVYAGTTVEDGVPYQMCAGLGTYPVLVNEDPSSWRPGDMLVAAGGGFATRAENQGAPPQAETLGKVLSNVPCETYDDGTCTIAAALYCG